jgi:hypothetical protein
MSEHTTGVWQFYARRDLVGPDPEQL